MIPDLPENEVMTSQRLDHTDLGDYDDAELDALIDTAMAELSAKLEATSDMKAGLADVYARAHLVGG